MFLVSGGTNPLPELMLTNLQWGLWQSYDGNLTGNSTVASAIKWTIYHYSHLSQGLMSPGTSCFDMGRWDTHILMTSIREMNHSDGRLCVLVPGNCCKVDMPQYRLYKCAKLNKCFSKPCLICFRKQQSNIRQFNTSMLHFSHLDQLRISNISFLNMCSIVIMCRSKYV